MKRVLAGLLTIAILGLMTWSGLRRAAAPSPANDRPAAIGRGTRASQTEGASDCIDRLLACARSGDVGAYLSAFGAPLRARLERDASERGLADFAARLKQAAQARKGHAVFAPELEGPDSTAVRITVESTYADRLERQTYRLERTSAGWRVTEVDMARDHVPAHLHGALATYEEPEGVPVPVPAEEE
jgi:hypothetical protein